MESIDEVETWTIQDLKKLLDRIELDAKGLRLLQDSALASAAG